LPDRRSITRFAADLNVLKRFSTTNAIANGPSNGRDGHARLPHHEYLKDYRDLVLWGGHAGILNSNAIESLLVGEEKVPEA
jgi:hypothetical protein